MPVPLCLASRETWDREIAHREDNQNAWAVCAAPPRATPPSIRNQKSSINNSHRVSGSVHSSAGTRVPVVARSLRKGGFAAKSRKSRIINKSKSFGRLRSTCVLSCLQSEIRNHQSTIHVWPAQPT